MNITSDLPSVYDGNFSDGNQSIIDEDHICKQVLYVEISYTRFRVWDLLLLIPVLLFLLGLLVKFNDARLRLRAVHSPIYATFYCLIWMNTVIALIRCIVSMTVNAATVSGDEANIILYVVMRFFLLATEMSVVVFAMFFGHLDNKTSIRRVLIVTSSIALPYSIVQGSLEILVPDPDFYISQKDYYLFGHGGSLFWLISSLIFALIYSIILILRLNFVRRRFLFLLWMPMKKNFYIYLAFLSSLNFAQCIGSAAYHYHKDFGLCLVDLTTWMYFSLLTPFIYYTFIYQFFRKKTGNQIENIVFSYKSDDDDTTSFPTSSDFHTLHPQYNDLNEVQDESLTIGSKDILSPSISGLPNNFIGVNPLYSTSLQSPESITNYPINNTYDKSITMPPYGV